MPRCSPKRFAWLSRATRNGRTVRFGLEKARASMLSPPLQNRATARSRAGYEIRRAHRGTGIDTQSPVGNLSRFARRARVSDGVQTERSVSIAALMTG